MSYWIDHINNCFLYVSKVGGKTYHDKIETENKTTPSKTREVPNIYHYVLFIIIRDTDNTDSNNLFVHIAVRRTETCRRRCRGLYA